MVRPSATQAAFTLSVIVPVRDRRDQLQHCLGALANSSRKADQIVVVDDASLDDSVDIALKFGATVVRSTGTAHGPAAARNRGAEASSGDILVFVDSDVMIHPDALGRIEQHFVRDAALTALFGAYDDSPTDRSFASTYRNLLHHDVHRQSRAEASTFWAGLGAIRRRAFIGLGGFDESLRFLEDVELGLRLHARRNRVLLCPEVQCTHRKRWGFWQMVYSDIAHRSVPWTRLIIRSGSLPDELNLSHRHRISAIAAWLLVALLLIAAVRIPHFYVATALPIVLLLGANLRLYRLFMRKRGFMFCLGAVLLHWLHHLYSSATFVVVLASASLGKLGATSSPATVFRKSPAVCAAEATRV